MEPSNSQLFAIIATFCAGGFAIFGTIVTAVIYSVRLEGRINSLKESQARLEAEIARIDGKHEKTDDVLSDIKQSVTLLNSRLTNIESLLEKNFRMRPRADQEDSR